eukprot:TRINITY_DN67_c1_g1_i2.p1 TRINITY_DN67_c1_g1~~TRINITY_DN67_c1_g1_i2.p1  ORF type:complete len:297 (+),score=58.49 TRINITY_DN67_c1_g1_i2:179-1069(+)
MQNKELSTVTKLGASVPKRRGFPSTMEEVTESHLNHFPKLRDLELKSIIDVDSQSVGEAYYEMQTKNPMFLEAKLTKEDIVAYGVHLAERAQHLAPWSIVLVDSEGTVAGMYISYPARSQYMEEERPKIIPKVCEDHWQTCLWFEEVVLKRARDHVKKLDSKANFNLCRCVFTGVHPKYRRIGVHEYVVSANAVAAELAGFSHFWSFTFNSVMMKKSLTGTGLPEPVAIYVADAIPKSSRWTLETLLFPTLKMFGFIRKSLHVLAVPRNGLSFTCGVWPSYDEPTVGRLSDKYAKL